MSNQTPYRVILDFEKEVALYTGAPYCIAVNSCTNALYLSLLWCKKQYTSETVYIPSKTYVSVPMQVIKAGFKLQFTDEDWEGMYRLTPFNLFDAARRFSKNMFVAAPFSYKSKNVIMCTSHHWTKILGIQHGGCILHNIPEADEFFRAMRHDGRIDGKPITNENIKYIGEHCPMPPENAAAGLVRLANLPDYNRDLPNSDYPDLSTFEVFK